MLPRVSSIAAPPRPYTRLLPSLVKGWLHNGACIYPQAPTSAHPPIQTSIYPMHASIALPSIHPRFHVSNSFMLAFTSTHALGHHASIHPPTDSIHSPTHSFVHSSAHTHMHPSIHSSMYSPIHSFIRAHTYSSIHRFTHLFIHLLTPTHTHSSNPPPPTHTHTHIHPPTHSFIHACMHSPTHSFIPLPPTPHTHTTLPPSTHTQPSPTHPPPHTPHPQPQFRSEMAAQAMQELVQKMTDKCFTKCTGKSGNRLESKVRQGKAPMNKGGPPIPHQKPNPMLMPIRNKIASPCAWTGTSRR